MKKALRIAARALLTCAFAFFLTIFIGEMLSETNLTLKSIPFDLWVVLGLFALMLIGYFICFKKTLVGALVIMAGALGCAAFMLIRVGLDDLDAAAIFGLPFTIPALVLILNRP